VLTQGATGLDFNAASGGTCSVGHSYAVGNTCTVNYTFKPTRPWIRYGGIALADSSGGLLGNTYVAGTGTGPQPIFSSNNNVANLANGFGLPYGVAVDGSGNIYVADATGRTSITRSKSRGRNPASQPERPKATTRNLDPIIARRSSLSRLSVVVIRHLGSQPAK
jgi:hypothetical protein